MTDRYSALIVVLEKNTRSDDAEGLIAALKLMRGVLDVQPHVADASSYVATTRVKAELARKLWNVLEDRDAD